jgi:hypothetical protein
MDYCSPYFNFAALKKIIYVLRLQSSFGSVLQSVLMSVCPYVSVSYVCVSLCLCLLCLCVFVVLP